MPVRDLFINITGSAVGAERAFTRAGRASAGFSRTVTIESARQAGAMGRMGVAAEAMGGRISRGGKAIHGAGASISRLSLPLAIAGGAATKFAIDFQSKMELIATQAHAGQGEVRRMTTAVERLAPKLGFGPTKLADALYHIESTGKRGSQALDILRASAHGAQVGNADLEQTTYALSSAVLSLGLKGKDAGKVMATLNAIVGAGDVRMSDLVDAMSTGLLPAARTFHVSLRSVGAALAYMTDRGVPAQLAATRLRMSIALLGAPSSKATKILKALGEGTGEVHARTKGMSDALTKAGLSTTRLSSDLRKPDGIYVALRDLKDHLHAAGISGPAAAALISRAFGGGRSGSAIMAMYNDLGKVQGKFGQIGKGAKKFPSDVRRTYQTERVKIGQAQAQIEVAALKIGGTLAPVAAKVAKAIGHVAEGFAKLPKWAQDAAIGGAVGVAALGPMLTISGNLLKVVGGITTGGGKLLRWMTGGSTAGKTAGRGGLLGGLGKVRGATAETPLYVWSVNGGGPGGKGLPGGKGTSAEGDLGKAGAAGGARAAAGRLGAGLVRGGLRGVTAMIAGSIITDVAKGLGAGHHATSFLHGASIGAGGFAFGPEVGIPSAIIGGIIGMNPYGHPSRLQRTDTRQQYGANAAGKRSAVGAVNPELAAEATKYRQLTKDIDHYQAILRDPHATRAAKQFAETRLSMLTRERRDLAASAQASHGWNLATAAANQGVAKSTRSSMGSAIGDIANFAFRGQRSFRGAAGVATDAANQIRRTVTSNTGKASDSAIGNIGRAATRTGRSFGAMSDNANATTAKLARRVAGHMGDARDSATGAISKAATRTGRSFGDMSDNANHTTALIARRVAGHMGDARDSAIGATGRMAGRVARNMGNMANTSSGAMDFIVRAANRDLKAFGAHPVKAGGLHFAAAAGAAAAKATGGYVVGRPGEAGPDNVEMDVPPGWFVANRHQQKVIRAGMLGMARGGTVPVVVGRGEVLIPPDQQGDADQAVQAMGYSGLDDLARRVNRPHYAARGGRVPMAYGGVTGPIASLISRLDRMGFHHGSTTGGTHAPGSYHYKGEAVDYGDASNDMRRLWRVVDPARRRFAELFGPSYLRPRPTLMHFGAGFSDPSLQSEHNNHIHMALAGGAVGRLASAAGGAGAGWTDVPRVRIAGPAGTPRTIAQHAADKVRKAANAYGRKQSGRLGGGNVPGGAAAPAQVRRWFTEALRITHHYTPGNLSGLIAMARGESGFNPRAINRTDSNAAKGTPSEGILQTIAPTFNRYKLPGHGNIWNPVDNAIASIRYQYATYGHIVGHAGYQRGGFVGMSRGGRAHHHRHHRHAPRHIRKRNPWTFQMQRHTAKDWRRIEGQYHTWLRGQRKPTFDQRLAQVDLGAARAAATTPSTQDDRGVARQRVTLLSGHLTGQRRRERTIRHHLNQHLSGNTRKRLKGELDQLVQDEAQTVSDLHDAQGVTSQGALDQLSGAEDLVDLHQQAGDITDDQAAKQKQALEGGALRGVYGKLSAHDRLTVRAEQHQAQTAAQSSLQQSIQALADELKTQNALNAKVNAVSSQAIFRALGAVVSGQIGGTTQVRSRSPGDGRSAIYV